jgi:hypothetical protein
MPKNILPIQLFAYVDLLLEQIVPLPRNPSIYSDLPGLPEDTYMGEASLRLKSLETLGKKLNEQIHTFGNMLVAKNLATDSEEYRTVRVEIEQLTMCWKVVDITAVYEMVAEYGWSEGEIYLMDRYWKIWRCKVHSLEKRKRIKAERLVH